MFFRIKVAFSVMMSIFENLAHSDKLPDEVKGNVVRFRAIKLFNSILNDVDLAALLEETINKTFSVTSQIPVYLESVTRFSDLLKSMTSADPKEFLKPELSKEGTVHLKKSFSYCTSLYLLI
jgi:hypothetical protein